MFQRIYYRGHCNLASFPVTGLAGHDVSTLLGLLVMTSEAYWACMTGHDVSSVLVLLVMTPAAFWSCWSWRQHHTWPAGHDVSTLLVLLVMTSVPYWSCWWWRHALLVLLVMTSAPWNAHFTWRYTCLANNSCLLSDPFTQGLFYTLFFSVWCLNICSILGDMPVYVTYNFKNAYSSSAQLNRHV